jgi:hypothetical protein
MVTHKTGSDIDAWCNKCKLVLAHIIIAINGAKVARVECKTCKAVHAFKATATKKAAPKKPGSRAAGASKELGPAEYEKIMKGQDTSRAQRYRTAVNYAQGDVLDHTTFGIGVVLRLLTDAKIEVIFPLGCKTLVHGREAGSRLNP